jgi:hypothetical protein
MHSIPKIVLLSQTPIRSDLPPARTIKVKSRSAASLSAGSSVQPKSDRTDKISIEHSKLYDSDQHRSINLQNIEPNVMANPMANTAADGLAVAQSTGVNTNHGQCRLANEI